MKRFITLTFLTVAFGFSAVAQTPTPTPDPNPDKTRADRLQARLNDFANLARYRDANGKYYLGSADDYEGRYSSVVAIADNIYGPYRMRHEAVPSGGGTNYFKDKQGNWWCAFFGNDEQVAWREKPGIVRVEFGKGGRISVMKNQPKWILAK